MGRLQGKVAVITGGATGIGAATARRFVEEGAKVLIADIQDEVGEKLAASLGDGVAYRHCNVAREEQVAAMVKDAHDRYGRVDVLYNNAGFVGVPGPFQDTSVDEYDLTMDVLLKSVFLGIKHVSPIMKDQRSGSIISTASVCGLVPAIGTAHLQRGQGRRGDDDQVGRPGVGRVGRAGQLHLPRLRRHPARGRGARCRRSTRRRRPSASTPPAPGRTGPSPSPAWASRPTSPTWPCSWPATTSAWMTGTAQVVDGGLTLGRPWRKLSPFITEHRPIRLYRPE